MKLQTIASQWDTFNAIVVPHDANPVQRKEMKRSFYAGFQQALLLMMEASDGTEAQACAQLSALQEECAQFAEDVQAGKV